MFRTQERNARLDASLDEKLDQFLADTFPCSDPLPQPLFVDPFTYSMHSDRRCVLESSRARRPESQGLLNAPDIPRPKLPRLAPRSSLFVAAVRSCS